MSGWIKAKKPPVRSESWLTVIIYRPEGFDIGVCCYPAYPGYYDTHSKKWYFLQDIEQEHPITGITHYQHLASLLWHKDEWLPVEQVEEA